MKRLLSIALTLFLASTIFAAESDRKYPDFSRWNDTMRNFEQLDAKNTFAENAVLFVGSSSIVGWKTAEAFPDLPVINRGFGGSWMAESLHFVDLLVIKHRPAVVVIYAGDNDIAGGLGADAVHKDFVALAQAIHAALPSTQIICVPIKPSQSRWNVWPRMQEANRLNSEYAGTVDYVTFVDLASILLGEDGTPDASLYKNDKLHLNDKGYEKWNRVLAPVLKKIYQSRPQ